MLAVAIVPVSELPFREFSTLLCLQAQSGHRPRFKTLQPVFLTGLVTIALTTVVDSCQR